MSKTGSLHYDMCLIGAKWLKQLPYACYKYIAVELVCMSAESPDVWGTNGCESTLVEVKVSRRDFLHDKNKFVRNNENFSTGNYRYYLCPDGLIKENEIPEKWGLLYCDDDAIRIIKRAEYQNVNNRSELEMLCSIMRREGIKPKIFNYRRNSNEKEMF